jgi:hypothetical protein
MIEWDGVLDGVTCRYDVTIESPILKVLIANCVFTNCSIIIQGILK